MKRFFTLIFAILLPTISLGY